MARKKTHKAQARELLEALGWAVADGEKHLRHTFVTQDLFGFADLLAVKGSDTLAVQVTSVPSRATHHVVNHQRKMLAEPRLAACLAAHWMIELWGIRNIVTQDGEAI